MTYKESIKINQSLINKLKNSLSDNDQIKNVLNCIEGDFVLYHGTYAQTKPFKFLLHFFKNLFYGKVYLLNDDSIYLATQNIACLVTAENIYKENLKPAIDILNSNGYEHYEYRLKIKKKLSFRIFRFKIKHAFSITNFFYKNINVLTFSNVLKLLYLKYILINDCLKLISFLENKVSKDHRIFLSAEICDTFSRAMASVCKSRKIKYVVFQPGPFETEENLEVQSVLADEFIVWPSSKNYFLNPANRLFDKKCNVSYFDSIRFLSSPNPKAIKKYDLVFFLTWLSHSSNKNKINQQLRDVLKYFSSNTNLQVVLKMHPATFEDQEKEYLFEYKDYEFIDKSIQSQSVISESRSVLNFGSTISFDADFQNVKTGIINFNKDIPDNHQFFNLNHVMNLRKLEDLRYFIDDFKPQPNNKQKELGNNIISYIKSLI